MQNIEEFEIKLYSTDDVCKLLHIGKQKCLQSNVLKNNVKV